MKVQRRELLKCLASVDIGLSKGDGIEQSSCYVFRGGRAWTFNEDLLCSIGLPKVLKDVEFAVPAKELKTVLSKLKEDEISAEFNVSESSELVIRSAGKKARRRAGIRVESEITLPVDGVAIADDWKKLPEGFVEAVDTVQGCAGRDDRQFVLVCVHIFSDGVEAMDNYQAVRCSLKTGTDESLLVKSEQLKNVMKLGVTEWAIDDSWVHFRNTELDLVVSCRRWNEKYPDLSKILKVAGTKSPLSKELVGAVEKAETFLDTDTDLSGMEVDLKPGKLTLRAEGMRGWYEEQQKIDYKGDPLHFRIAPRLLREICSRSDSCVVGEERLMVKTDKFTYVSCLTVVGDGDE